MAVQNNSASVNFNPALVLGALTVTTLVCREIGFANGFMWWVTSIFAVCFVFLVWLVTVGVAKANDGVMRGTLKVEKVNTLPVAFNKKNVITNLFVLWCMYMMDLQILMIVYALSYVLNQMVIGGYANTLKTVKERRDAQNA